MSLYNMLFGMNRAAPALLAALGLDSEAVGRFRDAYIDGEHIVIHTRNGGGNRDCWHADNPKWGAPTCEGESYQVEVDETVEVTEAEAKEKGYQLLNVFVGSKRMAKTGLKVVETRHTCTEPNSEKCGCPGCIINYRLPKHPNYISDADDDFDCTYADVRFSFPEQYATELCALADVGAVAPAEKWQMLFEKLESADKSDAVTANAAKVGESIIGPIAEKLGITPALSERCHDAEPKA
jgi:hypothetical protein